MSHISWSPFDLTAVNVMTFKTDQKSSALNKIVTRRQTGLQPREVIYEQENGVGKFSGRPTSHRCRLGEEE